MCYAGVSRGQKAVHLMRVSVGQPQRPTVRTLGSPIGQPNVLTLFSSNSPIVGATIGR